MSESEKSENKVIGEAAKATGVSLIFTLTAVLIFAFIIKIFNLNSGVIKPVNQFLKVMSIFTGCFFCISKNKGMLKGLLAGFLVVLLTYFIFAIISANINFSYLTIIEFIFGGLIGAISGIITVNLKK